MPAVLSEKKYQRQRQKRMVVDAFHDDAARISAGSPEQRRITTASLRWACCGTPWIRDDNNRIVIKTVDLAMVSMAMPRSAKHGISTGSRRPR